MVKYPIEFLNTLEPLFSARQWAASAEGTLAASAKWEVECPICRGTGRLAAGIRGGSDFTDFVCPVCDGGKKVIPPVYDLTELMGGFDLCPYCFEPPWHGVCETCQYWIDNEHS